MSEVFPWEKIPLAHMKMWKNQHPPGNMAVMVNAPRPGLKTFEDVQGSGRGAPSALAITEFNSPP